MATEKGRRACMHCRLLIVRCRQALSQTLLSCDEDPVEVCCIVRILCKQQTESNLMSRKRTQIQVQRRSNAQVSHRPHCKNQMLRCNVRLLRHCYTTLLSEPQSQSTREAYRSSSPAYDLKLESRSPPIARIPAPVQIELPSALRADFQLHFT